MLGQQRAEKGGKPPNPPAPLAPCPGMPPSSQWTVRTDIRGRRGREWRPAETPPERDTPTSPHPFPPPTPEGRITR